MTVLGNFTLCGAGWWIWRSARQADVNTTTKITNSSIKQD